MSVDSGPADSAAGCLRVVIVGGGSAGYLAALTLNRLNPKGVDVTVLDPDSIPTIGVGESTTSEMPPFLHRVLGVDVCRFYREVQPTLKLGIRFAWGEPGDDGFNYPFDRGDLRTAHLHEGHFDNATFGTMLMSAGRVPVLKTGADKHLSLLDCQPYGYHIDNARFLAFLRRIATERGVRVANQVVKEFVTASEGGLAAMRLEDDSLASFDLFVDCTGFRRALLGGALGTPFISFRDSLFCDSAVTGTLPHGGTIKPYTTAETMPSGWLWNIPQRGSDHVGYVFSSAHCSPDEARQYLRWQHPDIGFERDIRFQSGRLKQWVCGNVVALGNASAFVEPLESTALFMIVRQCLLLAHNVTAVAAGDELTAIRLNEAIASTWDYLRWFLSIHYRFNRRLDSPFWNDCRAEVDISGAEAILARYRQPASAVTAAAAGTARSGIWASPQTNFDAFGYEALLLGQGRVDVADSGASGPQHAPGASVTTADAR
jgi:tryptophan halogenase